MKNFKYGFNFSTPVDLCISYSIPTTRCGTQASYSSLYLSLPSYPHTPLLPIYLTQSARAPTSPSVWGVDARGLQRALRWRGAPPCTGRDYGSSSTGRHAKSGARSGDLASVGAHEDWDDGVSLCRFLTAGARRGGLQLGVALGGFPNRAPTSSLDRGSAPAANPWRGAAASADTAMKGQRSLRDPCSLPGPPLVHTQARHVVDSVAGGVRGQSGDDIELAR
jgi:hypothetical protein